MNCDSDSESASLQSVSSAENARSLEQIVRVDENLPGSLVDADANDIFIFVVNSHLQSLICVVPHFDKECSLHSEWATLWRDLEEDVVPLSPILRRYTDLANIVGPLNQCSVPVVQQIVCPILLCMVCAVEHTACTSTAPLAETNERCSSNVLDSRTRSTSSDPQLWAALVAKLCRSSRVTIGRYASQVVQRLKSLSRQHHRPCSTLHKPQVRKPETSVAAIAPVNTSVGVSSLRRAYMTCLPPMVTLRHAEPRAIAQLVVSTIVRCICQESSGGDYIHFTCSANRSLKPISRKAGPSATVRETLKIDQPNNATSSDSITSDASATKGNSSGAPYSTYVQVTSDIQLVLYTTIFQHVRTAFDSNTVVNWTDLDEELQKEKGTARKEWVKGVFPLARSNRMLHARLVDLQDLAALHNDRAQCVLVLSCVVDAVDMCSMCASICERGCLTKDSTSRGASSSTNADRSTTKRPYTSAEDVIVREAVRTWEQFGLTFYWVGVNRYLQRPNGSAQHRWKERLAFSVTKVGPPVQHASKPLEIYPFSSEEDALMVNHMKHVPQSGEAAVWNKLSVLLNRPVCALQNRYYRLKKIMAARGDTNETAIWDCYEARRAAATAQGSSLAPAGEAEVEVKNILAEMVSAVEDINRVTETFSSPPMPKKICFRAEKRTHFSLAEDKEIVKCARQRLCSFPSHTSPTLSGTACELQTQPEKRMQEVLNSAKTTSEALPASLQRWADLDKCLGRSPDACRQRFLRISPTQRYKLLTELEDCESTGSAAVLQNDSSAAFMDGTADTVTAERVIANFKAQQLAVLSVLRAVVWVLELTELFPLNARHFKL